MEVIVLESPEAVAARCADLICAVVQANARSVLGLATGSTPVASYKELIRRHQAGAVSFKEVTTFNLDEYIGLPPTHPQSYRYFMNEQLFDHIDIHLPRTHVPDGMVKNPMDSGPSYEALIARAGGIDLQVLGIGANGHIGFNEPTSSLRSRTRVKTLTQTTVEDNSRFFGPDEFQPRLAITMGIETILEARRVVLLATGDNKADAVAASVEGALCAMVPASALQLHPRCTFIIDRAAASKLKLVEYYQFVLGQQDALTHRFGFRV